MFKRIKQHLPIIIFAVLMLIIGLLIARDYGETIDDEDLRDYGQHTLLVYRELLKGNISTDPGPANLRYYGPAFLSVATLFGRFLETVIPILDSLSAFHYLIFVSFVIGCLALYDVGSRIFPQPVAFGVVILFAFQPLLWGHAFFNGKDIPLLAFLTAAVALGLRMEHQIPKRSVGEIRFQEVPSLAKQDWQHSSTVMRRRFYLFVTLLIFLFVLFLLTSVYGEALLTKIIGSAYERPDSLWGSAFFYAASQAQSVEPQSYVIKAFFWTQRLAMALCAIGLMLTFWALSKTLPKAFGLIIQPLRFFVPVAGFLKSRALWVAALALGFATSIRIIGPFAAILVFVYLVTKKGWPSLHLTIPYFAIATASTILFWPYLWPSPFARFLRSLEVMSNFPWFGKVFFAGQDFSPAALPALYLPTLLSIQLTIPALILIIAGVLLSLIQSKQLSPIILMLLAWGFIPFLYVIVSGATIYDNFRQLFFLVPPFFLLSGFALNWLLEQLNLRFFLVVLAIAALPGIIAIFNLHPYEYVYYNKFVNGLVGAEGHYELEYMASAFSEAAMELNAIAPLNSRIVVWGPPQIAGNVARPDLLVEPHRGGTYDLETGYHYVIINNRSGRDATPFRDAPIILTISRDGVPFAIVKQLNCNCGSLGN